MTSTKNLAGNYIRIEVVGNSTQLWVQLRDKLLEEIKGLLDTVETQPAHKLNSAVVTHRFPTGTAGTTIEIEKMHAEIRSMFAKAERDLAESEKIRSEASATQFGVKVSRLKLIVGMLRILMVPESGEEALLFSSLLEQLDDVLKRY